MNERYHTGVAETLSALQEVELDEECEAAIVARPVPNEGALRGSGSTVARTSSTMRTTSSDEGRYVTSRESVPYSRS